ncbi:MAG TPA: metallophosphoesterase [bacterium]|nr:metallophosphoesterase [bacterium]
MAKTKKWQRFLTGTAVVLCLAFMAVAIPTPGARASVRKAPYLIYAGDNTQMCVLWQLTTLDSCTIAWGTDQTYSLGNAVTHEYGTTHQHAYTIASLAPGTIYYYRVTAGSEQFTGSFRAAPPADATRLKFFAYGDTRSDPADHNQVAGRMISAYTADPEFQTFVLSVGDLVYYGDTETDWDNQFFSASYPNIRGMLAHLPYQSCMGNHEQTGTLFTKYFPYPFVSGRYWSFDYGPAHFAVVDQYTSYSSGTPQLLWLANDLASTSKPWKFVYLHEPGWSAGGGHPNNTSVQTYVEPLCEQYGVAILFAGHNHYYARAVVNGVEHVTTGGGGAPLVSPLGGYPNVVDTARVFHNCEIEIDGGTLSFQAVTPRDSVVDSFTLTLAGAAVRPGAGGEVAKASWLGTASPNPFESTTTVSYWLPKSSPVELAVYDVRGQKIRTLVAETVSAGSHSVVWDGRGASGVEVSTGIYFFRLEAGNSDYTAKVILRR